MTFIEFMRAQQIPYTAINCTYNKEGKKIVEQIKGIKDMTIEQCEKDPKQSKNPNYILYDFNKLKNTIIFDSDTQEAYDKLNEYLKENNIYNKKSITKSYGSKYGIKYGAKIDKPFGRHYYFIINSNEFDHISTIGKKLYDDDNNDIGDFFYKTGTIGELAETQLNYDEIEHMTYKQFEDLQKIFKIRIEYKKETQKPKQEKPIKQIKKNDIKIDSEDEEEEIKQIDNDNLVILMDNIDPKDCDNYYEWLKIAMIFKNENLNMKIFDSWSKKSDKYNKDLNNKILKSLKQTNKGYTIATLYMKCKEYNPTIYEILNKNRTDIDELIMKQDNNTIAKFYYNMNPDKFIYVSGDIGLWFSYDENNRIYGKCRNLPEMLNDISDTLQTLVTERLNKYIKKKDEKIKIYEKFYKWAGTSSNVKSCIDFLKKLYTNNDFIYKIDENNKLFAFNNCVYDLDIKGFRSINRSDYIEKSTGYNINAKSNPEIRKNLNRILFDIFDSEHMVEYYKKIISMSMFGNSDQVIYIHNGIGSNGKSLLFAFLGYCFGQYYYETDNTFFTKSNGAVNSNLSKSQGTRIILAQEPEGDTLNIDFIKLITGSETITTRALYQDNITFKKNFTTHLCCNTKPQLSKNEPAIYRRLKIINYNNEFVDKPTKPNEKIKDKELLNTLKTQPYINEFMLMLFENVNNWDKIKEPAEIAQQTNDYIDDINPILNYIKSFYNINRNRNINITNKLKGAEIYEHFKANTDNEHNLTQKLFYKLLSELGIKKNMFNGSVYFNNIEFVKK
jgi:P4 family phage/plasmid primase-like protien